ncbi:site-specific integrase [Pseudoalteromonas sp. NZS11]|uniref:site-specific integrase n=1 Tax=Pseudoalteromonas sp. NZS11 TaxID=2792049 RepID=UPI0018CD8226|nr:site-specific integrase [Pseudoalteromonas sp. NZS11]MBH0080848.1 site-specific integrase [Pseudoalteromonas sp. NZS11]
MATIRQLKSGNWNVQIREKGNRFSRTFLNLEDAERFAKTGTHTISFHSVCEQYIELKGESVKYRVRGLMKTFDTPPTKLDLEHYKKFRLRVVKSSTARLDLQMLSRIVKFGIEQLGLDWEFPFKNFKYPPESKGRDRVITELEYDMLLGDLPPLVASAAALSYETAMRRGEVSRVAKGHIEFENNRLYIPESKNGHSRYVPLNTKAIEILKRRLKVMDDNTLLYNVNAESLSKAFRRSCKRLGIEGLSFHSLRHSAITRYARKGLSVNQLKVISGHRSTEMLERYTHLGVNDVVTLMD